MTGATHWTDARLSAAALIKASIINDDEMSKYSPGTPTTESMNGWWSSLIGRRRH
jgi:hypothetical protein